MSFQTSVSIATLLKADGYKLKANKKRPNSELLWDIASKKQQDIKTREKSFLSDK